MKTKLILFGVLCCIMTLTTACNSYQRREAKRVKKEGRTLIKAQEKNGDTEAFTYSYDADGVYIDIEYCAGKVLNSADEYKVVKPFILASVSEIRDDQPKDVLCFQDFNNWDIYVYNCAYLVVASNGVWNKSIKDGYIHYDRGYLVKWGEQTIVEWSNIMVEPNYNSKQKGHLIAQFYGSLILDMFITNGTSQYRMQKVEDAIGINAMNQWDMIYSDYEDIASFWEDGDPSAYSINIDLYDHHPKGSIALNQEVCFRINAGEDELYCVWEQVINGDLPLAITANIKSTLHDKTISFITRQCIDYEEILKDYDKNQIKAAKQYEGKRLKLKIPIEKCYISSPSEQSLGKYYLVADLNMFKYDYISHVFLWSNDEQFEELDYPHTVYVETTFNKVYYEYGWRKMQLLNTDLLVW